MLMAYAKLFKNKILAQGKAEGKAEVYRELQQAQRKGITLEEVLQTHNVKNDNNAVDESSSLKSDNFTIL